MNVFESTFSLTVQNLLDSRSLKFIVSLTLHDRTTKSLLHLHKKKKPPSISAQFQVTLPLIVCKHHQIHTSSRDISPLFFSCPNRHLWPNSWKLWTKQSLSSSAVSAPMLRRYDQFVVIYYWMSAVEVPFFYYARVERIEIRLIWMTRKSSYFSISCTDTAFISLRCTILSLFCLCMSRRRCI